jgi:hypothetical protein
VAARDLHPLFLSWLGLQHSIPGEAIASSGASAARWSVGGTPDSDAVVDRHLAAIVARVRERSPEAEAIVLAGGFGRGEGTIVVPPGAAEPRPVNDYDVVVVGAEARALAGLDAALGADLAIDFVDLWARPDVRPTTPLSQFDFDLRYGATLLWGNPLVLDRLPRHAPADLGVDEGIFQIGSRAGGLWLGCAGDSGPGAPGGAPGFRARQRSKFLIAIADAWLMAHQDYHASYRVRRRRFAALGPGAFRDDVRAWIDDAFAAKLTGAAGPAAPDPIAQCADALAQLEGALGWDRDPSIVTAALARTVGMRVRAGLDWVEPARRRGLVAGAAGRSASPAAAIYRALVEGVRAWGDPEARRLARFAAALAPEFSIDAPTSAAAAAAIARTWLSVFHP